MNVPWQAVLHDDMALLVTVAAVPCIVVLGFFFLFDWNLFLIETFVFVFAVQHQVCEFKEEEFDDDIEALEQQRLEIITKNRTLIREKLFVSLSP